MKKTNLLALSALAIASVSLTSCENDPNAERKILNIGAAIIDVLRMDDRRGNNHHTQCSAPGRTCATPVPSPVVTYPVVNRPVVTQPVINTRPPVVVQPTQRPTVCNSPVRPTVSHTPMVHNNNPRPQKPRLFNRGRNNTPNNNPQIFPVATNNTPCGH